MKNNRISLGMQKNIAYIVSLLFSGLYFVNPLFLIPALATAVVAEKVLPKIEKRFSERLIEENIIRTQMTGKNEEEIARVIAAKQKEAKENKQITNSYNMIAFLSMPRAGYTFASMNGLYDPVRLNAFQKINPSVESRLFSILRRIEDNKNYYLDRNFNNFRKIDKSINSYFIIAAINGKSHYFCSLNSLIDDLIVFSDEQTSITEFRMVEFLGNIKDMNFYFIIDEQNLRLIVTKGNRILEYINHRWIEVDLDFDIDKKRTALEMKERDLFVRTRYLG